VLNGPARPSRECSHYSIAFMLSITLSTHLHKPKVKLRITYAEMFDDMMPFSSYDLYSPSTIRKIMSLSDLYQEAMPLCKKVQTTPYCTVLDYNPEIIPNFIHQRDTQLALQHLIAKATQTRAFNETEAAYRHPHDRDGARAPDVRASPLSCKTGP
jgi:hypothetical protein